MYNHSPALELNHFLFTGPGRCCPSRHVQGFEGNSISITKHGQPAQTHEERLGHPPNQCPGELTRPIPARACPGNVAHWSTRMPRHTQSHTHHSHNFKENAFLLIWQPWRPRLPHSEGRRHETHAFNKTLLYLQYFAKGQGPFFPMYYLSFVPGGGRYQCNLALFRSWEKS